MTREPDKRAVVRWLLVGLVALGVTLAFFALNPELIERLRVIMAPMREGVIIDTYANPLVWLAFVAIPILEFYFPVDKAQSVFSTAFLQDALYFIVSAVFRVACMSFYVAGLKWVFDHYLSFFTVTSLLTAPFWLRAVVAALVADFLAWLHHLIRHKFIPFWHFHAVHHSQRQMNLFTDVRVHPLERIFAQTIQFVPLFALTAGTPEVGAYALVHQWYTKLYHANIRSNFGLLKYILVTPQSHRVHHSTLREHYDMNYGVIFSVWDHLFGTQLKQYDIYPPTGVPDPEFPMPRTATLAEVLRTLALQMIYPFTWLLPRSERPTEAPAPGPS